MRMKKLLSAVVLMGAAVHLNALDAGILVPATPPCPEIDGEMERALLGADQEIVDLSTILSEAETPSENGCLPTLEKIGFAINASVPSLSMKGILTRLKESACKELDSALKRAIGDYEVAAKAPFGLGHINVGASTNGNQTKWESNNGKSVFDPITRDLIKMGTQTARDAIDNVQDELPNTDGINRTIKETTKESTDKYKDQVNGARDALNDL